MQRSITQRQIEMYLPLRMQRFDLLTDAEWGHVVNCFRHNPLLKVLSATSEFRFNAYRFDDNRFVVTDKLIGKGFWGEVYLAAQYNSDDLTSGGKKCVVKMPQQGEVIKDALNSMLNVHKSMEAEAALNHSLYGFGASMTCDIANKPVTVVVMPFLGDISLQKLVDRNQLKDIPLVQIIGKIFIPLCEKLGRLHALNYLHNDIKPENIGLVVNGGEDALRILDANFFDLGNAHEINKAGKFGDPKYQAKESVLLGWLFPAVKTEGIDIYALGLSFQQVINKLQQIGEMSTLEREICAKCLNMIASMTSDYPNKRPSLDWCLSQFEDWHNQLSALSSCELMTLSTGSVALTAAAAAASPSAAAAAAATTGSSSALSCRRG